MKCLSLYLKKKRILCELKRQFDYYYSHRQYNTAANIVARIDRVDKL